MVILVAMRLAKKENHMTRHKPETRRFLSPREIAHQQILSLPKGLRERKRIASLIRANIPQEFWHLDFRSFKGDPEAKRLVQFYCKRIDRAFEGGFGYLLTGPNGVGKMTLIALTLMKAIRKGYTAFYISLPAIFRLIYRAYEYPELLGELDDILQNTQFLAIGELGKDYHRRGSEGHAISEFDSIFRYRRGALLPTLMDTNMIEDELEDTYGESIISLFRSRLKIIRVTGKDYRARAQRRETDRFFED